MLKSDCCTCLLKGGRTVAYISQYNPLVAPWNKGVPWLQEASLSYLWRVRRVAPTNVRCFKYDEQFQMFCATQSKAIANAPPDPKTIRTYRSFCADLVEQGNMLFALGITMRLVDGEPYPSSDEMRSSLRRHKCVYIRRMDPMPNGHPLARNSPFGVSYLELFRLVHDVAVHGAFGFSFSARGEEAAAQTHMLMCSSSARPAVVAETRMQSAFFYAGDEACNGSGRILELNEPGYIPLRERNFAPQFAFYPSLLCRDYARWLVSQRKSPKAAGSIGVDSVEFQA
jgi:hypothetical protein